MEKIIQKLFKRKRKVAPSPNKQEENTGLENENEIISTIVQSSGEIARLQAFKDLSTFGFVPISL